ncbi:hypothetical protein G6F63_015256 [Rhizopus arrhizus]|nr:hypothetical protein G6F35_018996 [Rhizopus arrhizus]KAG1318351.1 hypothetical protein G6F63_015256 [Rhizopus arrhizus]
MATGRVPGLDIRASAAVAPLRLADAARPVHQRRPLAERTRQPAAGASRLRGGQRPGPGAGRSDGAVASA